MDLAIKNSLDLSKVKTGVPAYDQRLKAFQTFCNSKKMEVGLDSLKKYVSDDSLSVSTKKTTKTALLQALRKVYKHYPKELKDLEEGFKEIKTGKRQTIGIDFSECYSEKEIDFIIQALAKKTPSKKFNTDIQRFKKLSLIVWTLFNTGLRISELLSIRLDRIHLNGIAKLTVSGKGKKEREIFLPRNKVDEIKKVFKSKTYLFENNKGKKLDRINLTKILKAEIESVLPEKNFHPHLLRHSFATNQIISKKKSVKSISTYLGHSTTAITQDLYVHDNLEYSDLFKEEN